MLYKKVNIWPEWSDQDINAEKWDSLTTKTKERSKSPMMNASFCFEDPDGNVIVPLPFEIASYKRPNEILLDKSPVIHQPEVVKSFDLITCNENLLSSSLYCSILCEIGYLWNIFKTKANSAPSIELNHLFVDGFIYNWRPWEHIYSMNKIGKGLNTPLYNPFGKYAVKLFWMGAWRKILVDDYLPYDIDGNLLLPKSPFCQELWPMLLIKALLKVASLEIDLRDTKSQDYKFNAIHCLTGWVSHRLIISPKNSEMIWEYLKHYLTPWARPAKKQIEKEISQVNMSEKDVKNKDKKVPDTKGKDAGKEKKLTEKDKSKSLSPEEAPLSEYSENFVFACYNSANETSGFLPQFKHPVFLKQIRNISVSVPKPQKPTPKWKLIRPLSEEVVAKMEKVSKNVVDPREIILERNDPLWTKSVSESEDTTSEQPFIIEKEPIRSLLVQSYLYQYKTQAERLSALQEESLQSMLGSSQQLESIDLAENTNLLGTPSPVPGNEECGGLLKAPYSKNSKVSLTCTNISSQDSSRKNSNIHGSSQRDSLESRKKMNSRAEGTKSGAQSQISKRVELQQISLAIEEESMCSLSNQDPIKDLWVDISRFTKVFNEIYIFHKPTSHLFHKTFSELKFAGYPLDRVITGSEQQYIFIDSVQPIELIVQISPLNQWPPPLPNSQGIINMESLPSTQIINQTSKIARGATPSLSGEKKSVTPMDKSNTEVSFASQSSDVLANSMFKSIEAKDFVTGHLLMYKISWMKKNREQLVRQLDLIGPSSLALRLPPGRHCFQAIVDSPYGYHLQVLASPLVDKIAISASNQSIEGNPALFSSSKITETPVVLFGDANTVISKGLILDPICLKHKGTELIENFVSYAKVFGDFVINSEIGFKKVENHRKLFIDIIFEKLERKNQVWLDFLENFILFIDENLLAINITSNEVNQTIIALRILLGDYSSRNPLRQCFEANQEIIEPENPSSFLKQEDVTSEHLVAAVKIQAWFRGIFKRQIFNSFCGKTKALDYISKRFLKGNELILSIFQDSLHYENQGLKILRNFKPISYMFQDDEENCLTLSEFTGSVPELNSHKHVMYFTNDQEIQNSRKRSSGQAAWMTPLFRDLFFTTGKYDSITLMVEFQSTIPANLIIVDNSNQTSKLLQSDSQKTSSQIISFMSSEEGYTFIALRSFLNGNFSSGSWKLRFLGVGCLGLHGQLHLSGGKQSPMTQFNCQDFSEYFKPTVDRKTVIFKQLVEVTKNQLFSVHAQLSDPLVPMRLIVKEPETHNEVLNVEGIGEIRAPFFLLKCRPISDNSSSKMLGSSGSTNQTSGNSKKSPSKSIGAQRNKSQSRISRQGSGLVTNQSGNKSNSPIGGAKASSPSPGRKAGIKGRGPSTATTNSSEITGLGSLASATGQSRRYRIEIHVDSNKWGLSLSNWKFLDSAFHQREGELKIFGSRSGSARNSARASATKSGPTLSTNSGSKQLSRPSSVQLDISYAHWRMKIITNSDVTQDELIFIKPTTSRPDQIRALKKAWEEADPGRAEKADAARQNYLKSLKKSEIATPTDEQQHVYSPSPKSGPPSARGSGRSSKKSAKHLAQPSEIISVSNLGSQIVDGEATSLPISETQEATHLYSEEDMDRIFCTTPPPGYYEGYFTLTDCNEFVPRSSEELGDEVVLTPLQIHEKRKKAIQANRNIPKAILDFLEPPVVQSPEALARQIAKFKQYFQEWDTSLIEEATKRCTQKRKQIGLMQVIQLLTDKSRLMYYENCEGIRQKRIEDHEKATGANIEHNQENREEVKSSSSASKKEKKSPKK